MVNDEQDSWGRLKVLRHVGVHERTGGIGTEVGNLVIALLGDGKADEGEKGSNRGLHFA
jgi:hypothetical protein